MNPGPYRVWVSLPRITLVFLALTLIRMVAISENCAVSVRQSSSAWGSFARVQTRQTMIWPLWTPRRRNT